MLSILPPQLLRTPYADGNDVAGIRLPDVSVPSVTYTGWALRASDPRNPVAVLFTKTNAQRIEIGDPRRSIQERYPDHGTYVSLVTAAVQQLEEQRFLLDQDVQNYIQQANAVSVPRLPLTICEDAPKSYQADL